MRIEKGGVLGMDVENRCARRCPSTRGVTDSKDESLIPRSSSHKAPCDVLGLCHSQGWLPFRTLNWPPHSCTFRPTWTLWRRQSTWSAEFKVMNRHEKLRAQAYDTCGIRLRASTPRPHHDQAHMSTDLQSPAQQQLKHYHPRLHYIAITVITNYYKFS